MAAPQSCMRSWPDWGSPILSSSRWPFLRPRISSCENFVMGRTVQRNRTTHWLFRSPPESKSKETQPSSEQAEGPRYRDHAPAFSLPPLLMLAVNALRQSTASEIATLSGGEYLKFVTQ